MVQKNKLVSIANEEIVSLDEFKKHIKWNEDDTSEDVLMRRYLQAATIQAEQFTRRTLRRSNWYTWLDCFPSCIKLDVMPVDAESIVVKYYDTNNAEQTLSTSEYFIDDYGTDDLIEINFDGTMPTLYDSYYPVKIEFTAGYVGSTLPDGIRVAIMNQAANWFQNRENEANASGNASPMLQTSYQILYPYKML